MRVHHVLYGMIEMMARMMHVIWRGTFTLLRYITLRNANYFTITLRKISIESMIIFGYRP